MSVKGPVRRRAVQRIALESTLVLCLLLAACDGKNSEPAPAADPMIAPDPTPTSSEAAVPEVFDLEPGTPQTREIRRTAVHTYHFSAAPGDYLDLVVDQQGVDVKVILEAPDAVELLSADGLTSASGSERILWLAEQTGTYGLKVENPSGRPGIYVVRLAVGRPATERDRQRVAAATLFYEAESLRKSRAAKSEVLDKYDAALKHWHRLDDRTWEATTLYSLGAVHKLEGQKRKLESELRLAVEKFVPALELARDDIGLQAIIYPNLGSVYLDLFEMEQASRFLAEALERLEKERDLREWALAANNLGITKYLLGDLHEALTLYHRALELWSQLDDPREQSRTFHNRGKCYSLLGQRKQALADLEQALEIRRKHDDRSGQASTLTAIGQVYETQGRLDKALTFFENGLELRRDDHGRAVTLTGIASVRARLAARGSNQGSAELEKARNGFEQSLGIFREEGDRRAEAAVLRRLGWLHLTAGNPSVALELFHQALGLSRDVVGDRNSEAGLLVDIARAERRRDRLGAAQQSIEEAVRKIEHLRRQPASDILRSSYFATKQETYAFYIDLLMELHRRDPSAGHDAAALAVSERARARSLLDTLIESGAEFQRGTDPELLERERRLERHIHALEVQRLMISGSGDPDRIAALGNELRALVSKREIVRGEIRRTNSRYAALTQPRTLSAREIQEQVLDEETLLLEFALGEKRSYLWAVSTDSIASFELPGRVEIEKLARDSYGLLTDSHKRRYMIQAERFLATLGNLLLEPVAAQLKQRQRLLVVSDGVLQYIPFAALPSPRAQDGGSPAPPLVASHEIVGMPSASALAVVRRQVTGRASAPGTVAVIADPVFHRRDPRILPGIPGAPEESIVGSRGDDDLPGRFERLPFSAKEADGILALVSPDKSFRALGLEATKETVTSGRLSDFKIVHFATHGRLNTEFPDLTSLVLSLVSPGGLPRDGFLRLQEIYNLDLPAELVVVSACQTALGAEIKGEGLVGLTQGFMYAGAARVLVSLWNVNDEATAKMMHYFYRSLLVDQVSPAAALRAAQTALRAERRWQAPFYWAGFVLQGEWQANSEKNF